MNDTLNDKLYEDLPQISFVLGAALVCLGIVVLVINATRLTTLSAVGIVVMIGVGIILAIVGADGNGRSDK